MTERTVNVAEYLFTRLVQLGCTSLHGLPGDFNLLALDFVEPSGLRWVGNCNELNAGYAADAYARLRGLGAICTTFGVGELSAVNAIAGSFAELAPVVHIVGVPGRPSQKEGMLLHHTLGNGDFTVFARMYKEITIAQADLLDPATAPAEIDRVLRTCYVESRPVYIQLPTDMVEQPVPAHLLDTPIDVASHVSDKEAEDFATGIVLDRLYEAEHPVFLIDGAVQRRGIRPQVEALVNKAGIPTFVAPMGKGVINEDLPNFVGLYAGDVSAKGITEAIEKSDLVITIGNIKSDLNTAGFTYRFSRLNTIDIHYNHVDVKYAKIENVYFKSLVPRLERELNPPKLAQTARQIPSMPAPQAVEETDKNLITHAWLWPRLSSFMQEGDVLVTETGTSYLGHWETKLPRNVTIINQILWSSIGYGVGATQGAALATKEFGKGQRVICFEGDGSFQLTAQELSTIIRHDLKVTMFLIENSGYEIERWVHGMEADYNDIPQWQYSKFPETLIPEGSSHKVKTWKIRTRQEFDELLNNSAFANGEGLQFVEMHMPKGDAPKTLQEFGRGAAARAS
ncbi:hypothetical protein PRZ48_012641 [Zasmidium cellare]|uniref:Pyruvate decarboxylase n=1 Tax=Zasmidium cellare TaxID=395010 RepID=A0ABR0E5G4_ZASCE|nr:hypothetical protein PRZ48_012641 [Zasmidium cellare]